MRIAIIIPAFNVAPFLGEAIRSALAQTHTNWSLMVVDDGSTDATATVAASFQDKRIHLIQQDNAGVSAARNRGIRHAEATAPDAFLFLDGDDWLAPNALERLADAFDSAPWAVAACGRCARVTADGTTHLSPAPHDGCLLERLLIRNLFANGGHLLIRRQAVHAAGDFRSDLSYGEDWEYWTRLALLGEFVSVRSRTPVLFVRERAGSAMLTKAMDPAAYRPALDAIHRNPAIATRLGGSRLPHLRRRADAEMAWAVGRELIRHGQQRAGQRWLGRSIAGAPSIRRMMLIGLSWLRIGPFRPYRTAA
ncbi:glycosyltransferase family A protein [Acidisphaera sp. S103]|uniref:glycosyltransferase family 2 protein n=1 Tax=Acidisphaera sp. S103 TaxID=1747223 RepID=UPI00131C2A30|nr:glycosyltransferase family A protein [Acidisphaera sp. S103]